MKKLILATTLLFSFGLPVMARKKGHNIKVFTEASTFLNLNAADIQGGQNLSLLHQKNNFGGSFGLGIKVNPPRNITLQLSMGLRFTPQHMEFRKWSKTADERYTNTDYYLRFILGYSCQVAKGMKLDIGLGFQNYYSLSSKNTGAHLHSQKVLLPTQQEESYLSDVYEVTWGDSRETADRLLIPFIFNPLLHAGLINTTWLKQERQLGLAFEISSGVNTGNTNHGYAHILDQQRNIVATQTYQDRYTAISLILSMTLF